MALQINNFTGFETQGAEEADSVNNIAFETTNHRSGDAALSFDASLDSFTFPWVADNITDAGGDYIFGFAIRKSDNPSNATVVQVRDDSAGAILEIRLNSSGTLSMRDADTGTLDISFVLDDDRWYFVEVYAQLNNASGNWEWFIDGVSEGSGSGADFTDGNAFGSSSALVLSGAPNITTLLFDDVYILSGATAASDRLGDCEVLVYQNDLASATADDGAVGSDPGTLDTGNWDDSAETPGNNANNSAFTVTAADSGVAYTDGGSRAGPSGDADIDGDSNIRAWKGVWNADRTGGGGTTHTIYIGNDSDVTDGFDSAIVTLLNGTVDEFTLLGETDPPLSTENFAQGFGKSSGGRDFDNRDMWAMLLHIPSAAPTGDPLLGGLTLLGVGR